MGWGSPDCLPCHGCAGPLHRPVCPLGSGPHHVLVLRQSRTLGVGPYLRRWGGQATVHMRDSHFMEPATSRNWGEGQGPFGACLWSRC